MSASYVCFECSARSAWHIHPKGQLLVVTEGFGIIQESFNFYQLDGIYDEVSGQEYKNCPRSLP